MASEDVIELGSSDDEAEQPAPKRRRHMLNAMVHIPGQLPGLSIKPVKQLKNPLHKGVLKKPIVIKPGKPPLPVIPNVQLIKKCPTTTVRPASQAFKNKPVLLPPNCSINPLNILKNTEIAIKKIPPLKKPIKVANPGILNNLPPSITIKKAKPARVLQMANISAMRRNPIAVGKSNIAKSVNNSGEVLTVNLDDDDGTSSSAHSPQWYLRPEQAVTPNIGKEDLADKVSEMEQQNNKEPEGSKYVEITIEDSPIKPVNKQTNEIGCELPITIEDSPIKAINKKSSNSRINEKIDNEESPQSKKRLDYPKNSVDNDVVEIEIVPVESTDKHNEECKAPDKTDSVVQPITKQSEKTSEPETKSQPSITNKETIISDNNPKEDIVIPDEEVGSEFHPIYQSFIKTCFTLENSDDMKKIVEKKIKTYYKQCRKEYVESEEFLEMVSSKISAMKAGPDKMYLYIKDVVDELNLQRKMAKSEILNKENIAEESNTKTFYEEEYDTKRKRQIRKLEKTIKKLHRAIQKLEEQEVDFEDEDDSVYLLTERYKERMVRVHAKFCQLTNTKMPSEPRVVLEARPGRPAGPVKKLEKWINKKVPIGTPLPFPDFHDVLRCVREANEEDKLGWNEVDIMEEARDLFSRCGKKLQRRRQENEWRLASSRISMDVDPAEKSEELKIKLNQNKALAAKKETEVLNRFVDRQDQLKLEAVEIGDKEAEESPVESDEEEQADVSESLEDKDKRKDRLKRLLLEKNKKATEITPKPDESKDVQAAEITMEDKKSSDKNNEDASELQNQTENQAVKKDEVTTDEIKDDKVHTVSDNSDNSLESDIDELHLLQKLHSENEGCTSAFESSDSDSPIAISDTLESGSDEGNVKKISEDVISIENSSYSESESQDTNVEKNVIAMEVDEQHIENVASSNSEVESTRNRNTEIGPKESKKSENKEIISELDNFNKTISQENNNIERIAKVDDGNTEIISKEDNEDEIEKILLASSDDDENMDKENDLKDTILITEQLIETVEDSQNENINRKSAVENIGTCENLKHVDSENNFLNDNSSIESVESCVNRKDANKDLDSENDHKNEENNIVGTSINLKDDIISVTETSVGCKSKGNKNENANEKINTENDISLRDDTMYITENSIEGMDWDGENDYVDKGSTESTETCINLNDDAISITENTIEAGNQDKNTEGSKREKENDDIIDERVHKNKFDSKIDDSTPTCDNNEECAVHIDDTKSVESIESVPVEETKSVESVESVHINDTHSVESVESVHINETKSVQSLESGAIDDAKSVESIESDHNVEETKSVASIEFLNENKTDTIEMDNTFECNGNSNIIESANV